MGALQKTLSSFHYEDVAKVGMLYSAEFEVTSQRWLVFIQLMIVIL